ncbi:MAG: hypothetical protein AABW58_03400 [Nanoarchaeota archaeon]
MLEDLIYRPYQFSMDRSIKELFERGIFSLALLPDKNDFLLTQEGKILRDKLIEEKRVEEFHKLPANERLRYISLDRLDSLDGYTVPLTAHDYGAKTPVMWNSLYQQHNINIRNLMVVADPDYLPEIIPVLKNDPMYLGGGMAVGFKEKILSFLDIVKPSDLKAVNIVYKKDSRLIGENTDALGFVKSLEESLALVGKEIKGSNLVIYGSGGVAKEVTKLLAEKGAARIRIVNRTFSKAVALAHYLNETYGLVAEGIGEELSRGVVLNSEIKADALVNLSDKGSDGALVDAAMYAEASQYNESKSRDILRYLKSLRPDIVIADIVLPKIQPSISLRLAKAEGLQNLLDGKPMVINQAAPAYILVQGSHPSKHAKILSESEVLSTMRTAATK